MSRERTRILIVDDEEIVRESLSSWLEKDGYTLATAADGSQALERLKADPWSIVLVDLRMPGMDGLQFLEEARKLQPSLAAVVMTAYATVDTAAATMKLGAHDYLVKPFDPEELSLMIRKIVAQQALVRDNVLLRRTLRREHRFGDFVSKSVRMQAVFDLARTAAGSASAILVLGERGTGKEVLARAVHAESPRRDGPFVAVPCAALTETLLESELFGHEKGTFPGATTRRMGRFEEADGGTLFLDEIGALTPKTQLDLLRMLEDRRFAHAGGTEPVQVGVRIVAATNRDLRKAVETGGFREDLLQRLSGVTVTIPPLRDRPEDVPLLVEHLLEQLAAEMDKRVDALAPEAMRLLLAHSWPGNVRELRNVLERAVVVATGAVVQAADLGLMPAAPVLTGTDGPASLEEVERRHIGGVLHETGGNISQAARILGIDRATLYNKMRRYQLRRDGGPEGDDLLEPRDLTAR